MNKRIVGLLQEALICSVFADPADPGLSTDELSEVGRQAGFQDGEIGDAIHETVATRYSRSRLLPEQHPLMLAEIFGTFGPRIMDVSVADFVCEALNERIRADGYRQARLDRGALVERAVTAGHDRLAIEGAITCLVLSGFLKQDESTLSAPPSSNGPRKLISEQHQPSTSRTRPLLPKAQTLVRDVVARRTDGRPRNAEPFDAFGDALERIGFRQFRSWWRQTVTELRGSDPGTAPTACTVLSAALVEGALTFAARHARDRQLGSFQSSNFEGEPRNWKAEKLIESAALGGAAAILTLPLKARAEHLNRARQRVHVGRLLSENPSGVPDLRPEEGRDAKATAEQIVRAVLDWLERAATNQREGDVR